MIVKIILFFILFIIIRKMLEIHANIKIVKRHFEDIKSKPQNNSDAIEADYKVISEE